MTGEDVQRLRSNRAVVAENDNLRAQLRGAIGAQKGSKSKVKLSASLRAHAIDQHRIDVAERLAVAGQLDDANRELETLRERSKSLMKQRSNSARQRTKLWSCQESCRPCQSRSDAGEEQRQASPRADVKKPS